FFFQAEDGIRDKLVTGVQTCALPIWDVELTIGRGLSNHVCISDPILSRQHCVITSENGQFVIRDLGSRHGTLVNGVPISQQVLHHDDKISLGSSVFAFMLREDEEVAQPQSSHAELEDTSEVAGAQTMLRQEDALYLQPETITRDFVQG